VLLISSFMMIIMSTMNIISLMYVIYVRTNCMRPILICVCINGRAGSELQEKLVCFVLHVAHIASLLCV